MGGEVGVGGGHAVRGWGGGRRVGSWIGMAGAVVSELPYKRFTGLISGVSSIFGGGRRFWGSSGRAFSSSRSSQTTRLQAISSDVVQVLLEFKASCT
jgi:hypothetical protein